MNDRSPASPLQTLVWVTKGSHTNGEEWNFVVVFDEIE